MAELTDQWSAYDIRMQGDLADDELTNVVVEPAPGAGGEQVVDEFDCPVPAGSGGDPQAVVDQSTDIDVRTISAWTHQDAVDVSVPYLDRRVAEAVCGLAGPGVAVHLGAISTVT